MRLPCWPWLTSEVPGIPVGTAARWSNILQNNSKVAAKIIFWQRNFGCRMAPNFDQKGQKRGRKRFLVFIFLKFNFWCSQFGLVIKNILPNYNANVFLQNFFLKLTKNLNLDLATVPVGSPLSPQLVIQVGRHSHMFSILYSEFYAVFSSDPCSHFGYVSL